MINERNAKMYCKEDISLIENYELAKNDRTQTWICHHRLETIDKFGNLRDEEIPSDVLIDLRIYCNRPASELIFVSKSMHTSIHSKIRKSPWLASIASHPGESNGMYGKKHTEESLMKMSKNRKGKSAVSGRHFYNDGLHEVLAFECPSGFTKGRLPRTYNTRPKGDER